MAVSLNVFPSFYVGTAAKLTGSFSAVVKMGPNKIRSVRIRNPRILAESEQSTGTKTRAPRGIMKPRRVSQEMRDFLGGVAEIPRTKALKEIWAYIKQQNLQDPTDKKIIICDEKLKKIFGGRDQVGFLEISGLISPHFLK